MNKISALWLFGYPVVFFMGFFLASCFSHPAPGDGFVRVNEEWITVAEYLKRYCKEGTV